MNISSEETILTDKLIESIIGYLMEGVHSGKRYRVKFPLVSRIWFKVEDLPGVISLNSTLHDSKGKCSKIIIEEI